MSYSSAVEKFWFSTTDYCTIELASAAKRTQYSLQEREVLFRITHRGHLMLTESTSDQSTVVVERRAVVTDITLPNSNTRREELLREFSETTLPEKTTLAARVRKATR